MGPRKTERILLLYMIIYRLSTAGADYKNDAWHVITQIDSSSDYDNRPVCNGNLVDLMCYTDAIVIHRDCFWECAFGEIKNRWSDEIMHETIAGHSYAGPAWFCTVKAPTLCNCTCTGSLRGSLRRFKIGEKP